jgi:hypothetical protein
MAKKSSLGRWISKIKLFRKNPQRTHVATLSVRGKTKKQAAANARAVARHHVKNIEMGFYDSSGFHPIRASRDYSGAQAGEKRVRSYKARGTRLKSATKHGRIR